LVCSGDLFLRLLARCDIAGDADHANQLALTIVDSRVICLHRKDRSISMLHEKLT
jgi:hypothetical protein